MTNPRIYSSRQLSEHEQSVYCPRCHQEEDTYIELGCGHRFCIVCITFTYLKYKNTLVQQNKLKCLECQKLSDLDSELYELINVIISKELGPIVKSQTETCNLNPSQQHQNHQDTLDNLSQGQARQFKGSLESRMSINQLVNIVGEASQNRIPNRQMFKSQEESFVGGHNLTPGKNNNYFYSKCESPNSSVRESGNDTCQQHGGEQISYICLTCCAKPLCFKCFNQNKHQNHKVKAVQKAIQILNQKVCLLNLQTAQKIQNIQLYQKRLYDRKLLFEERIQKSIKEIRAVFAGLEKKIAEKSAEIITEYQQFYFSKIQQLETKAQQSSRFLKQIQQYQQRIHKFLTQTENTPSSTKSIKFKPMPIIQSYELLQTQRRQFFQTNEQQFITFNNQNHKLFQIHESIIDPLNNYNTELMRWVGKISEEIDNMKFGDFGVECLFQNQKNQTVSWQPNDCDVKNSQGDFVFYKNATGQRAKFNETAPYSALMKSDQLFGKNKTVAFRNCSSRQKLPKNTEPFSNEHYGKRLKTNIPASLNTSRDKREKKQNNKTEEDERRFKSKANYKTDSNTISKNSTNILENHRNSKEIPAYINKYIERHHLGGNQSRKVSPFSHTAAYMMDNLQTSKNHSKIVSKNSNVLNNDDMNNRKKNKESIQFEVIKQKKQTIKSAKNSQTVKRKK